MQLEDYFDQVWVINLKSRRERLARFWNEIDKVNWPFRRPQVFNAIEGDKVGVPKFWQTGGGSYGCLRSHLVILERAIQDDVKSVLILEDDAVFRSNFGCDVAVFLAKVPNDWECLMLGGQHVNSQPIVVTPDIIRAGTGGGIQRTHCYALRGLPAMRALYRAWANAAVHCDWVMGPCMAKFNTYAPQPFLVGQADGRSDISGRENPAKFWRSPNGTEPIVVLRAPRPVMEALQKRGWHGGYTRDSDTGIDVGLKDIFADTKLSSDARNARLKKWIDLIQAEVTSLEGPAICTIWHPKIRGTMIRSLVKGKVITIAAATEDEAIRQLPKDLDNPLLKTDDRINVIILRSPRNVMESLRKEGWHTGYWRDEVTGQDNGLRRIFASNIGNKERKNELQRLARLLDEEAQELPGGIATFWHDAIIPKLLESGDIHVMEIRASTANEAILRRKELNPG